MENTERDINVVTLRGTIKSPPVYVLRQKSSGPVPIVKFVLKVDAGGSKTNYFFVIAENKNAEVIMSNFVAGKKITFSGFVKNNNYQDANMTNHFENIIYLTELKNIVFSEETPLYNDLMIPTEYEVNTIMDLLNIS